MSRWRYRQGDDAESFEKKSRMRSKAKASRTSKIKLSGSFELKEKKWPKIDGGFVGRVVEVHKRYAFISPEPEIGAIDTNDVWLGRIARKYLTAERNERNFVSVGDRILCRPAKASEKEVQSDLPQCVIEQLSPRHSKISRVDPLLKDREHVLAANVDQLLITASYLSPRIKWGLIDRYLVLAELQRVEPIIVLNKLDLLNEKKQDTKFYQDCLERKEYYKTLGYQVFNVQANSQSAPQQEEFKNLGDALADKISMFSGHSGVGKSSIINIFDPEIIQEVEPDSDIFYKGRHTTTYASFIKLDNNGYVIDTPGIRSFALQTVSAIDLTYGFVDIREIAKSCKFRECGHLQEPDCAVVAAVADQKIPEWRYKHYQGILLGTTGREGRMRDMTEKE